MKNYQLTEQQLKILIRKASHISLDNGITLMQDIDKVFEDFLKEHTQNVGTEKATKFGERYGTVTNNVVQEMNVPTMKRIGVICNNTREFKEFTKKSIPNERLLVRDGYASIEIDNIIFTYVAVTNIETIRGNIFDTAVMVDDCSGKQQELFKEIQYHLR